MAASLPDPGEDQGRQTIRRHVDDLGRIAREVDQGISLWSQHTASAAAAVRSYTRLQGFDLLPPRSRTGVIECLQQIALHNRSTESLSEVIEWCSVAWLNILEHDSNDFNALYGLGLLWLSKAQPILHRIYELDRRSSSSDSSIEMAASFQPDGVTGPTDEAEDDIQARVNSADFVEARTYLQPATEYFDRAIQALNARGAVNWDLHVRAAEAYISLGNTSSPRINRTYFRRAIRFIQDMVDANNPVGPSLQQFVDEYGRFVD